MTGILAMLGAMFFWGIWGYSSHFAVARAHPFTVQMIFSLPQVILLPFWFMMSHKYDVSGRPGVYTIVWTLISCLASLTAVFMYNTAMKIERASLVVGVTSAYPLVTIALLILTGVEAFRWTHVLGAVLIVSGVICLQLHPS